MCSVVKCIKQNKPYMYFKWFNKNTKQKDINDYILAKGDVNIFTDAKLLDKLTVSSLMMKLYLVENGMWNISEAVDGKNAQWKQRKV